MNPSATIKSAQSTRSFSHSSPPEGNLPLKTRCFLSRESWTIISSLSHNFCPNLAINSSGLVRRWKPVATRILTCTSGFWLLISSNKIGKVILLGIGLVWSLVINSTRWAFDAISDSCGDAIGSAKACRTMSCSVRFTSGALDSGSRTALSCSGSISKDNCSRP